jgi:hypothetical protein
MVAKVGEYRESGLKNEFLGPLNSIAMSSQTLVLANTIHKG